MAVTDQQCVVVCFPVMFKLFFLGKTKVKMFFRLDKIFNMYEYERLRFEMFEMCEESLSKICQGCRV